MRPGSHMADEQKALNSATLVGRVMPESTRLAIHKANLGSHRSEESKARMSAAHMGHKASPETKAKISIALKGRPGVIPSEETRAKQSASHKGKPGIVLSPESRAKISATLMGHPVLPETRAKMSANHVGKLPSLETRAKLSAANWKGGSPVYGRKSRAKRRALGFSPLNKWFVGCEGHHVDDEQVIYMPKKLHRSVFHRQTDGLGMAKVNAIAYNYLFKEEVTSALTS